jgi:hypothetical protein
MIAYRRSFWFRLLREPLKLVMRVWVMLSGIDLTAYQFATPMCRNCNRSYKNALKDQSPIFRKLNEIINPYFDKILERIVGQQAIRDARSFARNRECIDNIDSPDLWTKI